MGAKLLIGSFCDLTKLSRCASLIFYYAYEINGYRDYDPYFPWG